MSYSKIGINDIVNKDSLQLVNIDTFRNMKKDEKLAYLKLKKHPDAKKWSDEIIEKIFIENQITDTTRRTDLILDYLNELLEAWGEARIDRIENFKNKDKNNFFEEKSDIIFKKYLEKFCDEFGKSPLKYSLSSKLPNYIMTVTKKILELCGYKLKFSTRIDYERVGDENVKIFKSIVNIVKMKDDTLQK